MFLIMVQCMPLIDSWQAPDCEVWWREVLRAEAPSSCHPMIYLIESGDLKKALARPYERY